MFYEAPFLSLLIFGFPFGVISIVCYFLCCVDSSDQSEGENDEYSDTEEEDEHQYLLNEAASVSGEALKENRLTSEQTLSNEELNSLNIDPEKIKMKPIKISKKTQ